MNGLECSVFFYRCSLILVKLHDFYMNFNNLQKRMSFLDLYVVFGPKSAQNLGSERFLGGPYTARLESLDVDVRVSGEKKRLRPR